MDQLSLWLNSPGSPLPFANTLLKIHYSFPTKYWLSLCIFLQSFHFSFTIKIAYYHVYSSYLSCSDAFATTIINILPLRIKGRLRGEVPPQKPGLLTFRNCLEGETLSAKRKNPRVGSRPAYSIQGP